MKENHYEKKWLTGILLLMLVCGTVSILLLHNPSLPAGINIKETLATDITDSISTGVFDEADQSEVISIAHAAKALALLFAADGYFKNNPTGDIWYEPYIEYLAGCRIWKDLNIRFASLDHVAVTGDIQRKLIEACRNYYLSDEACDDLLKECGSADLAVSSGQWWDFFEKVAQCFGCESRIIPVDFSVYATGETQNRSGSAIYTDLGLIYTTGFSMEEYRDCRMRGWLIGGELVFYEKMNNEKVIYENALIIHASAQELEFFYEGMTKRYVLSKELPEIKNEDVIANILFEDGKLCQIMVKDSKKSLEVLFRDAYGLYLENEGYLPYAEQLQLYNLRRNEDGTLSFVENGEKEDIILGCQRQDYVIADGKIQAVITTDDFVPEQVRVLIKTDGYQSLFHEEVTISAPSGCRVRNLSNGQVLAKSDSFSFHVQDMPSADSFSETIFCIEPCDEKEELTIQTIKRANGNPSYKGRLELRNVKDPQTNKNGLLIINQLPIEEYLKRVVPSEMPAGYGVEAARVQAVCARSYAFRQMQAGKYAEYGAHVDDSSSFQVYNNSGEKEVSTQGVLDTEGEVLVDSVTNEVIVAYYFSTSCGTTTNAGIWTDSPQNAPYLAECMVYPTSQESSGVYEVDKMQDEAYFSEFIRTVDDQALEKNCAWYRWQCDLMLTNLTERVNQTLYARSSSNPNLTLVLQKDGSYQPEVLSTVGEVLALRILERGAGGVVAKLEVVGDQASVILCKQSNIRAILGGTDVVYCNLSGEGVSGRSILPSAFFTLEPMLEDGVCVGYRLYGGGNGHGLGLSQNGAKAMADLGMDYQSILQFFYQNCRIEKFTK